ncbi:MAG: NADH-quinone oxidoreductase subunit B family protein [Synergistaceae bacterium]|jgi:membrane-bound hydrogenase subunit mbhJ|nr:NADH-quinone oxidoreductase subunit B family protein [Synergistaceae bacterium]
MKLFNMLKVLPKSLWVTTCNSGSCNGCDIEIVATLSPRYDIERFGMKLVGTPRHADVLIVTGPVTKFMRPKLLRIYSQIPAPKVVVVVGNCGCSGDVFYKSYNLDGPVDNVIPVDVYVHGCPPRPEAIIEGVAKAVLKLESLEKAESAAREAAESAEPLLEEVAL